MNVQAVWWLVFLAQTINSSSHGTLFKLQDSHLTAVEGSCVEIKCIVPTTVDVDGAYWFWMKNAIWSKHNFTATIIYSTNNVTRPVSPDYANRVEYIGSPSSEWKTGYTSTPKPQCSILICNLKKNDSGNYSFRFIGKAEDYKWVTPSVNITVAENPCPITFEKPPLINEFDTITLTCSTLSSCPSNLQIQDLTQRSLTPLENSQQTVGGLQKHTTVSFTASWQDDGRTFSCQTQDNKDTHLIRNISVAVEYAPKEILAKINPAKAKEGQSVTLTCSAKGHPAPNFTWFRNEQKYLGAEWKFMPIKDSNSGNYHCEAENRHGTIESEAVVVNVTYKPEVEVKMTPSASEVTTGDEITLFCDVKRSNPQPHSYIWWKDNTAVAWQQTYVINSIKPEDRGFYKCRATNTAGTGQSAVKQINVRYSPMKTSISITEGDKKVKVHSSLTFTCTTDANPAPMIFSWYRFNKKKQIHSSQWTSKTTPGSVLRLESVERADEACYECNATNIISTGYSSEQLCIEVLYPPTEPTLSLSVDGEVTEGQLVTFTCTVESAPLSQLTLTWTSTSNLQSSKVLFPQLNSNTLKYAFNVTSDNTGSYTCNAQNSEGSKTSQQRKLVVKYRPQNVKVLAHPDFVVNENESLSLTCTAQSYPPLTSVTWRKMTDGKTEIISGWSVTVKSVSPSDSGLYICEASNEIGTVKSQQAEVKVKYAPKQTNITRLAEQQNSDGKSSVTLMCSSDGYPPVTEYVWFKKTKVEKKDKDKTMYENQNYTVFSDKPGEYYCIAKNEINQRKSAHIELFVEGGLVKALKYFCLFLSILLIIFFIVFVYRRKRNKSIQQGTLNTQPCFGFLGWWNGPRRTRMNESVMAEPFRSRDDLLQEQSCRPKAQRRQPCPDSTPASNTNTVYCTVNHPAGKQGPSAQAPVRQQGGHAQADSLNYASLHFANKQKNKQAKAEGDVVYAMVQKTPTKDGQEVLEDYENLHTAHAAKSPDPLNYDSDTSEDEVDYSQVNFQAKPGHERSSSDSSTSDEDETQYSEVKI